MGFRLLAPGFWNYARQEWECGFDGWACTPKAEFKCLIKAVDSRFLGGLRRIAFGAAQEFGVATDGR